MYEGSSPSDYVVADNFLSADALDVLLQFVHEATIWFDPKPGYLGAYGSDGFDNPVLDQLVQELRARAIQNQIQTLVHIDKV